MGVSVAVPVEQFWHRVPGGTARATGSTLDALATEAPDLDVVPMAAWHRPTRRERPGLPSGVCYARLPRPVLYESWLRFGQPTVERLVGPVDVVWAAAMIIPPTRAPVVATVHDLGFLADEDRLTRRGRSFFPRVWEGVRDEAAIIVCPSKVVADECTANGIDPERVRVISWGVANPLSSEAEANRVREELGLPERFVLWVGTLEPRKNLPRLVEAMTQIPDIALAVVGPPGWNVDGRDVFGGLEGRVHRLGFVDEQTLSALYRAATAFVYPSLLEGFGLPVLEAMAHGTPVITSAGTATEEVAGGAAILVNAMDPCNIASGITQVLDGDEMIDSLVDRGLKRASELSWTATAKHYAETIRDLVG